MDPNENLREQRELAEKIIREIDAGMFDLLETEVERLAELVLALDAWLLKGGVFPKAWAGR